jgi:uncharacterized RDD family membrane protein YckC
VPPGWYPDPDGSGGQRYYDGADWTSYRARAPRPAYPPNWAPPGYGYPGWGPPWKGAQLGRPAVGPGSLADPGRRLGARLLDGIVLIPVFIVLAAIAVAVIAPHAGPMFPKTSPDPNATSPTPGFVWIYLGVFGAGLLTGVATVFYEAVATARYGRTLGKAWLHIRPVRIDGAPIGWARSFGRISLYWISGCVSYVGLLNPLWCLWDANRQCLHDKAVGTIVVND